MIPSWCGSKQAIGIRYKLLLCCFTWASGSDCFHESDVLVEFEPIDGCVDPNRKRVQTVSPSLSVGPFSSNLSTSWDCFGKPICLDCICSADGWLWSKSWLPADVCRHLAYGNLGGEKKFNPCFFVEGRLFVIIKLLSSSVFFCLELFFSWALFIR